VDYRTGTFRTMMPVPVHLWRSHGLLD